MEIQYRLRCECGIPVAYTCISYDEFENTRQNQDLKSSNRPFIYFFEGALTEKMKESKLISELITYKETILLHLKKKIAKKWRFSLRFFSSIKNLIFRWFFIGFSLIFLEATIFYFPFSKLIYKNLIIENVMIKDQLLTDLSASLKFVEITAIFLNANANYSTILLSYIQNSSGIILSLLRVNPKSFKMPFSNW